LPADLYERVERKSQLAGAPFSTTLAEIARRGLDREDQARLEEALLLDSEANAAFSAGVGAVTSRIMGSGSGEPGP
jgi:hypothetical protein